MVELGEFFAMRWERNIGSVGIGALIVFIAVVIIAGIVASVLISISSKLESQSLSTGIQTTYEVSTGLKISDIEGHNTSGLIDKLIIMITPRAGSRPIDLSFTFLELSNGSIKCIFNYTSANWVNSTSGVSDLFAANAFPSVASQFGLIILRDYDGSCLQNNPLITEGDLIGVTVNTTACFHGIGPNTDIFGLLVPEIGAGGPIAFKTPPTFAETIFRFTP